MKVNLFLKRLVILGGVFFLTACSGPTAVPTPPVITPPTATLFPAQLSTPSSTPGADSVPSSTPTNSPPGITADPGANFTQARVSRHGKIDNWKYFVTITTPGQVTGNFYARVNQTKPYECIVSEKINGQITCTGDMAAFGDYVDLELYTPENTKPVFTSRFYIPAE